MVKAELGWSQDKAEMFTAIANNEVLTNPNMFGLLPPSLTTLHLMSKAKDKVLEAHLTNGTWNTETQIKDVRAVLEPPKKRQPAPKAAATPKPEKPVQAIVEPTPPITNKDELLTVLEKALTGDVVFQTKVEALLVRVRTAPKDDDDGVAEILQAVIDKPLSGDRPPPTPAPGPVQEMSAESIVPENAPRLTAEDEFDRIVGPMPDFMVRRGEDDRPSGRPLDDHRERESGSGSLTRRHP